MFYSPKQLHQHYQHPPAQTVQTLSLLKPVYMFTGVEFICVCAGFANEGQFLLMNSASLADMNARITAQARSQKDRTASNPGHLSRFRPNLLVGGTNIAAYAEDDWQQVRIGTSDFFTAGEASNAVLKFRLHALVSIAVHEAQPKSSVFAFHAACFLASIAVQDMQQV